MGSSRKWWAKHEDKILRDNYPVMPLPEFIHLLPGRSLYSAYMRANRLRLKKYEGCNKRWYRSQEPDHVAQKPVLKVLTSDEIQEKIAATRRIIEKELEDDQVLGGKPPGPVLVYAGACGG